MKGFHADIEQLTLENDNFRKVLYTGKNSQLVLMCLLPGEEIGVETHAENDQFFRFESGVGEVVIDGTSYEVGDGSAIVVPAGAEHNVINRSNHDTLNLYMIYSPPHHKDGVVRKTRQEAMDDEPEFDGETSE